MLRNDEYSWSVGAALKESIWEFEKYAEVYQNAYKTQTKTIRDFKYGTVVKNIKKFEHNVDFKKKSFFGDI